MLHILCQMCETLKLMLCTCVHDAHVFWEILSSTGMLYDILSTWSRRNTPTDRHTDRQTLTRLGLIITIRHIRMHCNSLLVHTTQAIPSVVYTRRKHTDNSDSPRAHTRGLLEAWNGYVSRQKNICQPRVDGEIFEPFKRGPVIFDVEWLHSLSNAVLNSKSLTRVTTSLHRSPYIPAKCLTCDSERCVYGFSMCHTLEVVHLCHTRKKGEYTADKNWLVAPFKAREYF